jgi:hypothetical protein
MHTQVVIQARDPQHCLGGRLQQALLCLLVKSCRSSCQVRNNVLYKLDKSILLLGKSLIRGTQTTARQNVKAVVISSDVRYFSTMVFSHTLVIYL